MAWFNPEALSIVTQWHLAYIAPILLALPFIYGVWHFFLRKREKSKKPNNKKKRSEKQTGGGLKKSKSEVNEPLVQSKGQGKKKEIVKNKPQEPAEFCVEIVGTNRGNKVESLNGVKKGMSVTSSRRKSDKPVKRTTARTLISDSAEFIAVNGTVVERKSVDNEEEWQEVRSRKKVRKS